MGFGSVHAPIVSAKLVNNVLGFSASFILPCNRDHTIGKNVSIIVMPILLRALQNIFGFTLSQKQSWLCYRKCPDSGQGGKSLHFLSDANMSEENVLVSDLKEVTLSSVKELITIVFSLRALYDLNQMKDLA